MKIAFAGGGTLGPVTPLLAVSRYLCGVGPGIEFIWFGTPSGPERPLMQTEGIRFFEVPVAKLPRYPSTRWLTFPVDQARARALAAAVLDKEQPDVVVSAGGFTAVPVIEEARKRGIPCAIHQLDLVPGLSNKRVAALCQSVTTSFRYASPPFSGVKSEQIPTPVLYQAENLPERGEALRSFGLDSGRPCVLIVGGGTGSLALNESIAADLDQWLARTQVIHSTGEGKRGALVSRAGYFVDERFDIESMRRAYAAADLVVSRAGMGALSELSALAKACILVPIPKNQQEANAQELEGRGGVVVVNQTQPGFAQRLRLAAFELLDDAARRCELASKLHESLPTDDGARLAEIVMNLIKTKNPT